MCLEKTRKNKVLAHTVCENSLALAFLLFLSLNKHDHLADVKSKFQRQKVSMAAERGLCFLPAAVSVCQICSKRRRCRYGSKFSVLFFLRSARGERSSGVFRCGPRAERTTLVGDLEKRRLTRGALFQHKL